MKKKKLIKKKIKNPLLKRNNLSAKINYKSVPFINNTSNLAKDNIIPGGSKNNFDYFKSLIHFDESIKKYQKLMLADAQTSGGLLIAVSNKYLNEVLDFLNKYNPYETKIIGSFLVKNDKNIIIKNE